MFNLNFIRKKSKAQEVRTAKEFGGKTTPASGAIDGMKGDIRTGSKGTGFNENDFLIENKYTDDSHYTLKLSIWEKIAKEALRDGMRTPLMQIDIKDIQLVVMDYSYYDCVIKNHINPFTVSEIMKSSHRLKYEDFRIRIDEANRQRALSAVLKLETRHLSINKNVSLVILEKDVFLGAIKGLK